MAPSLVVSLTFNPMFSTTPLMFGPNITGGHGNMSPKGNNWASGAFSADELGQSAGGYSADYEHVIVVGFSANRSSLVYRDDGETVQPKSVRLIPCIKF